MYNIKMMLKPQDIVVAMKLCGYAPNARPPYGSIATELKMSASEIHSAVQRLKGSRLLHGSEMNEKPNLSALEEFLIHGVKYAFPATRGGMTRGMPTSYAAEPLCRLIKAGNEPVPVWADPEGTTRGIALAPLYKTVPEAAKLDSLLYERLALIDAIRDGRTRERNLAEKELKNSLKQIEASL
jgi:DNA-binding Lrp family transcriptional regulator